MSRARTLGATLLATCLLAAAVPDGPAAVADSDPRAATAAPKAQSSQSRRTLARRVARVRRRTARAERRLRSLVTAFAALPGAITNGDMTLDGKINTIVGSVTPLLQQLGQGSLDLKAALESLSAGVTSGFADVSAGFDEVEAGLTDVGDFLGATEHGFGQVLVGATPEAGAFVVTPDIPDTVQQAQALQQFVAAGTGNVSVAYGVRSGESDGTGASNPAALCRVTVTNDGGSTEATAFQPVATRSALTSTTPANANFPFGLKTDNTAGDADVTTTFASSVAVTAGETYTVGLACVDTSASDTDPKA